MKRAVLFQLGLIVFFIFSCFSGFSQNPLTRIYDYDAAGNRVLRYVLDMSTLTPRSLSTQNDSVNNEHVYYTDRFGELNMRVYPNPTVGQLIISVEDYSDNVQGELWLYNLQGQLLRQFTVRSAQTQIDLSFCSAGNYLLKLNFNGVVQEWKIVKQ